MGRPLSHGHPYLRVNMLMSLHSTAYFHLCRRNLHVSLRFSTSCLLSLRSGLMERPPQHLFPFPTLLKSSYKISCLAFIQFAEQSHTSTNQQPSVQLLIQSYRVSLESMFSPSLCFAYKLLKMVA